MPFKGNHRCTSFKLGQLRALHDFDNHTFKLALYTDAANLDAETTDYTSDGEIPASGGYTAGGVALTLAGTFSGNKRAWADFEDLIISGAHTARGALIYNTTAGGGSGTTDAVCVLDFGRDVTSVNQFEIKFPTPDWLNAIVLNK